MVTSKFTARSKDTCVDVKNRCIANYTQHSGLLSESDRELLLNDREIAAKAVFHEDMALLISLALLVSLMSVLIIVGGGICNSGQPLWLVGSLFTVLCDFARKMTGYCRESIDERLECLRSHKEGLLAIDAVLRGRFERKILEAVPEKRIYRELPSQLELYWGFALAVGVLMAVTGIVTKVFA